MKAITSWLKRLRNIDHGQIIRHLFRVYVPGKQPLDITNWLIECEPRPIYSRNPNQNVTETMSVGWLVDEKRNLTSLFDQQRLSVELGALFSFALDRRVSIPFEVSLNIQGTDQYIFTPYSEIVDRTILGPIHSDSLSRIVALFSSIQNLSEADQGTIGDAISLYHASMILFDKEIRSAYTLIIAGMEVLAMAYGDPPKEWTDWEDHKKWETLFDRIELSCEQSEQIKFEMLRNRNLRLKATFRKYCNERLSDAFWDNEYEEWMNPLDGNKGVRMEQFLYKKRKISETLPKDRGLLCKLLGISYDLRSKFVHRGHWLGPIDLASPPNGLVPPDKPIPYSILRQLFCELIKSEISDRSSPSDLPDCKLSRK